MEYAQQRVLGSTGIVAAHRAAWAVYKKSENGHLLFCPLKVNVGYGHKAVEYIIAPPDGQVQIISCDVNKTADDVEAENRQKRNAKRGTKLAECLDWLTGYVGTDGKPAEEIFAAGATAGFAKDMIKQASKIANFVKKKESFAGGWTWHPAEGAEEGCTQEENPPFGDESNADPVETSTAPKSGLVSANSDDTPLGEAGSGGDSGADLPADECDGSIKDCVVADENSDVNRMLFEAAEDECG